MPAGVLRCWRRVLGCWVLAVVQEEVLGTSRSSGMLVGVLGTSRVCWVLAGCWWGCWVACGGAGCVLGDSMGASGVWWGACVCAGVLGACWCGGRGAGVLGASRGASGRY